MAPFDLASKVKSIAQLSGARLITLTGGEPFLQKDSEMEELVMNLKGWGYKVEAFTNGTIPYEDWAVNEVSMIMDWKLPGSGENPQDGVRLKNLMKLDESIRADHSIKFVCKDITDFHYAFLLWQTYVQKLNGIQVFYGKVWDGDISDAILAEAVMKAGLPWRLNRQEHNYIWPANERGR